MVTVIFDNHSELALMVVKAPHNAVCLAKQDFNVRIGRHQYMPRHGKTCTCMECFCAWLRENGRLEIVPFDTF